jgi:hypothetical protein
LSKYTPQEIKITDYDDQQMYYLRRERWMEALLAGTYTQGQGRLVKTALSYYETTKHCCLGVACDVFKEDLGISLVAGDSYEDRAGDVASLLLPESLRIYLGLSKEHQNILSVANDTGADFKTIAAIIRNLDYYKD